MKNSYDHLMKQMKVILKDVKEIKESSQEIQEAGGLPIWGWGLVITFFGVFYAIMLIDFFMTQGAKSKINGGILNGEHDYDYLEEQLQN